MPPLKTSTNNMCIVAATKVQIVRSSPFPHASQFPCFCVNLYNINLGFVKNIDRSVIFSSTAVSSTNKTDRYDITEILFKVVLNTINHTTIFNTKAIHLILRHTIADIIQYKHFLSSTTSQRCKSHTTI